MSVYESEPDFYLYVQNIDKIPLVKCPVLVIHVSTRDLLFCFLAM